MTASRVFEVANVTTEGAINIKSRRYIGIKNGSHFLNDAALRLLLYCNEYLRIILALSLHNTRTNRHETERLISLLTLATLWLLMLSANQKQTSQRLNNDSTLARR